MINKIRKYIFYIFTFIFIFSIVGYMSNIISASNAVDKTKSYLLAKLESQSPSKGKEINWINENDIKQYDQSYDVEIFGVKTAPPWFYPDKEYGPKYKPEAPWAYIKTRKWDLPFVVFNYYGWLADSLWGSGGAKIYVCLFGYSIEITDFKIWVA